MQELDTEVEGDPDSFTATCQFLRETSANVERTEQKYVSTRGEAEGGWGGAAGEGFRDIVFSSARMAGDTVQMLSEVCSSLEIHADDLRTVEADMQRARDRAVEGGLTITGFKIQPPGSAPEAPAPLPSGRPASPQQTEAHAAGVAAQADYERKLNAYNDAAGLVSEAQKKEADSQAWLVKTVSGVMDPPKLMLTGGDIATGLAGVVTTNATKWKAVADRIASPDLPAKMAQNTTMSAATRFRMAEIAAERSTGKAVAYANAYPNKVAAWLDKSPPWAKATLDAKIIPHSAPSPTTPILRGAVNVGKKLPYVGLLFTGAGVTYDIQQGKDPTQAVVSGGASFVGGAVAGASIGAAFGGPVGVVGGALVGIGIGIAVDSGWELFD
ncbi:hypothetical protein GIY23_19925 [Allosaccharopolyspora coralli]|uniref:Uncharacterized protein n=1 Tax=Allosaccharopolyspora coralli TaxID=2665642 RepID=A0A5Q3QDN6_9PSEU|nr:hypothetical protein [Allosaccharopolyspora coralli]QGK71476.1 hypothetical protein GIY23_19925 [Allosaccharopolyspora coralli]